MPPPRPTFLLFCLLLTGLSLLLFTFAPLAVTQAANPAREQVISVLSNLKAWNPQIWREDELEDAAMVDALEGAETTPLPGGAGAEEAAGEEEVEVEVAPSQTEALSVPEFGDDPEEGGATGTAEVEAGAGTGADAPLEPCLRTLLFHFGGNRGFASEYNRFVRIATVAAHFEYEVIPVATDWMYGEYHDYFKLPKHRCSIAGAPGWSGRRPMKPTKGEKLDSPAWTKHAHIQDGGYNSIDYVDDVFLAISTSRKAVQRLHTSEIDRFPPHLPLSGLETVPTEMLEAFRMQAEQVAQFWILADEVQVMVDALRSELAWTDASEEGHQEVIGMHIRLGDKCSETGNDKYTPMRFATPAQRLAHSSSPHGGNACSEQSASGGLDHLHASIYLSAAEEAAGNLQLSDPNPAARGTKPILAIMSDDAGALDKLRKAGGEETLGDFEGVLLPEVAKKVGREALGGEGGADMRDLEDGFQSGKFPELTMETRVTATRRFVRDLTIVGAGADAFIFTGSSNVGRLTALLGGAEKARTGRYLSCDSRWFGTAHYT